MTGNGSEQKTRQLVNSFGGSLPPHLPYCIDTWESALTQCIHCFDDFFGRGIGLKPVPKILYLSSFREYQLNSGLANNY